VATGVHSCSFVLLLRCDEKMLHAYYELFLLFGIKVRQVFFESIPSTAIVQSFAETENYELGSKLIYNTAK